MYIYIYMYLPLSRSQSIGYEALRSKGKLKGEGGDREGGGGCGRVQKDGMRSDGETSDPTEEELASVQVSNITEGQRSRSSLFF